MTMMVVVVSSILSFRNTGSGETDNEEKRKMNLSASTFPGGKDKTQKTAPYEIVYGCISKKNMLCGAKKGFGPP